MKHFQYLNISSLDSSLIYLVENVILYFRIVYLEPINLDEVHGAVRDYDEDLPGDPVHLAEDTQIVTLYSKGNLLLHKVLIIPNT